MDWMMEKTAERGEEIGKLHYYSGSDGIVNNFLLRKKRTRAANHEDKESQKPRVNRVLVLLVFLSEEKAR
jgi:hypothetical protein